MKLKGKRGEKYLIKCWGCNGLMNPRDGIVRLGSKDKGEIIAEATAM
jgi:hypothetical protein